MGLTRRNFLQQAGFVLLALGSDGQSIGVPSLTASLGSSYLQALAQPQGRKLALLVGIDRYSYSKNLSGCATDVELQRELLVRRFGFHQDDVLVLTDQQATREDIETAFIEHLIEQAKEGDVVVFHFSGYGSQVKIPPASEGLSERLVKSLLPFDGLLPTKGTPANNDLLLETLSLLAQSLATQQVTFVLDTSYQRTGQLLQGHLRSRSPLIPVAEAPSPQELAFQEQLKGRKLSRKLSGEYDLPGVTLLAAAEEQMALEGQWDGFSAGLFTYAIAQYLWQTTPASTLYITLDRATERMAQFASQRPQLPQASKLKPSPLTYFALPPEPIGAEGVAIAIEDNGTTVRLHLAGLPPTVLAYYQPNSRLLLSLKTPGETANSTLQAEPKTLQLQIRSREGLSATAKVAGDALPEGVQLQPGLLAREWIRVLPRNVGLTVALATDLERIERVDATSAFSNVSAASSVVLAGEQMADCLFGKGRKSSPSPVSRNGSSASAAPESTGRGYELFTIGRVPIPNTVGSPGEAISSAVDRLTPKLQTLLAVKLWRLTLNEGSSRLGVRVKLVSLNPLPKPLLERSALRSDRKTPLEVASPLPGRAASDSPLPTLATRDRIQYVWENFSDRPLFIMLFGLDARGNAIALYASESEENTLQPKQVLIEPATALTLPQSASSYWTVSEAPGLTEIYAIASRTPFTKTLQALAAFPYPPSAGEQLQEVRNPVEVARALLQDLHDASAVSPDVLGSVTDVYAFDVNAWASLSLSYQVVQGVS